MKFKSLILTTLNYIVDALTIIVLDIVRMFLSIFWFLNFLKLWIGRKIVERLNQVENLSGNDRLAIVINLASESPFTDNLLIENKQNNFHYYINLINREYPVWLNVLLIFTLIRMLLIKAIILLKMSLNKIYSFFTKNAEIPSFIVDLTCIIILSVIAYFILVP